MQVLSTGSAPVAALAFPALPCSVVKSEHFPRTASFRGPLQAHFPSLFAPTLLSCQMSPFWHLDALHRSIPPLAFFACTVRVSLSFRFDFPFGIIPAYYFSGDHSL